jgi:hypothetical protein
MGNKSQGAVGYLSIEVSVLALSQTKVLFGFFDENFDIPSNLV